ncbi:hypothetical protein PR202_gb21464 [Eleusine coracana subsp. coracana]|uniref:Ubiquitin-activating enzyme SCCH domain-containing protein n=1 Tax=Eleusine coracana subsp. coracana TaxID=191504 RepID=A0AAV5FD95_ELECO|nr:hypothetical protein PR202_gb21464 [Eleusine coracana subsp. coracana]
MTDCVLCSLFTALFGQRTCFLQSCLVIETRIMILMCTPKMMIAIQKLMYFVRNEDEGLDQYARRIYDHVFGYNIEVALANEDTWKNRKRPYPIYVKDALPDDAVQHNGCSRDAKNEEQEPSAMASLGLRNPQEIWSLADNSRIFLEAFKLFFEKREKDVGSLIFDKDDQLAVEFVTAAANIRASSFGIPLHSLFEAKGVAGNIVHAVATTNAIIAGLIVIEAIKVLKNDYQNYR